MTQETGNIDAFGNAGYVLETLPPELANSLSRQNIIATDALLPGFKEGFFECHLAHPGHVDFAIPVALHNNAGQLQTLENNFPSFHFIRQIRESHFFAAANSQNIWLEFDTSTKSYKGIAGIFFDLPYAEPSASDLWKKRLEETIPVIGTPQYTPANLSAMLSYISRIQQGFPAHIGIMTGRNNDLRLCVKFVNPARVMDYLHANGQRLAAETTNKLTALLSLSDIAATDFDFEDGGIASRIGVELHVSKYRNNRLYLERLFNQLLGFYLCTQQQKVQLLGWLKNEDQPNADCLHTISHIKLTLNQGVISTAKAYLHYTYK